MSSFLVPSSVMNIFSSMSFLTINGVVRDSSDDPVSRLVVIFGANNLSNSLGITRSSSIDGSFSFSVPGAPTIEFACVVQGEAGENCVVHSHKTAG